MIKLIKRLANKWKYRGKHWNCATKLPSPQINLIIEDKLGNYHEGKRHSHLPYLEKSMAGDLGYRCNLGYPIIAKRWRYA